MKKPVLNNWPRLVDYLTAAMAHERKEHFRLLFLNKKNELIGDEVQGSGTIDHNARLSARGDETRPRSRRDRYHPGP